MAEKKIFIDLNLSSIGKVLNPQSIGTTSAVDLPFFTNNIERLKIKSDGQILINTAQINYGKLEIAGDGAGAPTISVKDTSTGGIAFFNSSNVRQGWLFQSGSMSFDCKEGLYINTGTDDLVFRSTTSITERMRIKSSTGNILINTTTDAGYKLDVNGTSYFRDKLELAYQKVIRTSSQGLELRRSDDAGSSTSFATIKFLSSESVQINKTLMSGTGIFGHSSFSELSCSLNIGYYGTTFKSSGAGTGGWEWTFQTGQTSIQAGLFRVRNNTTTVFDIKANGNVLIGTTVDTGVKLSVNGSGRISGQMSSGSIYTDSEIIAETRIRLNPSNAYSNGEMAVEIKGKTSIGWTGTIWDGWDLEQLQSNFTEMRIFTVGNGNGSVVNDSGVWLYNNIKNTFIQLG